MGNIFLSNIGISIFISMLILASCNSNSNSIDYYDSQYGYSQTVVIKENDKLTIYVSGQVGKGSNLREQTRDAFNNLKLELKKHGCDFSNLIKINTYIVDYHPSDLRDFNFVREEVFGSDVVPANTLVGVTALALPQWKIEIEGVAVLFLK